MRRRMVLCFAAIVLFSYSFIGCEEEEPEEQEQERQERDEAKIWGTWIRTDPQGNTSEFEFLRNGTVKIDDTYQGETHSDESEYRVRGGRRI